MAEAVKDELEANCVVCGHTELEHELALTECRNRSKNIRLLSWARITRLRSPPKNADTHSSLYGTFLRPTWVTRLMTKENEENEEQDFRDACRRKRRPRRNPVSPR